MAECSARCPGKVQFQVTDSDGEESEHENEEKSCIPQGDTPQIEPPSARINAPRETNLFSPLTKKSDLATETAVKPETTRVCALDGKSETSMKDTKSENDDASFTVVVSRNARKKMAKERNRVEKSSGKSFPPSIVLTGCTDPNRWDLQRQTVIKEIFPKCCHAFLHRWGGIRIQFKTEEEAKAAMGSLNKKEFCEKLGPGTVASRPGAKNRIALVQVPKSIQICDILRSLNEKHGGVKLVTSRGGRHSRKHTLILTVPEDVREQLIRAGVAQIGPFLSAKVEEPHQLMHRQCHYCQSWSHISKFCTEKRPTCRKCAGRHKSSECISKRVKCANCGLAHFSSAIVCAVNPNRKMHEQRKKARAKTRSHTHPPLHIGPERCQKTHQPKLPQRGSRLLHHSKAVRNLDCQVRKPQKMMDRVNGLPTKPLRSTKKRQSTKKPSRPQLTQSTKKAKFVWRKKVPKHTCVAAAYPNGRGALGSEKLLSIITTALVKHNEETALHSIRDALHLNGATWAANQVTSALTKRDTNTGGARAVQLDDNATDAGVARGGERSDKDDSVSGGARSGQLSDDNAATGGIRGGQLDDDVAGGARGGQIDGIHAGGARGGDFNNDDAGGARHVQVDNDDAGGARDGQLDDAATGGIHSGQFDDDVAGGARGGQFDDFHAGGARGGDFDNDDAGGARHVQVDNDDAGGARDGQLDEAATGGIRGGQLDDDVVGVARDGQLDDEDTDGSRGGQFDDTHAGGARVGELNNNDAGGARLGHLDDVAVGGARGGHLDDVAGGACDGQPNDEDAGGARNDQLDKDDTGGARHGQLVNDDAGDARGGQLEDDVAGGAHHGQLNDDNGNGAGGGQLDDDGAGNDINIDSKREADVSTGKAKHFTPAKFTITALERINASFEVDQDTPASHSQPSVRRSARLAKSSFMATCIGVAAASHKSPKKGWRYPHRRRVIFNFAKKPGAPDTGHSEKSPSARTARPRRKRRSSENAAAAIESSKRRKRHNKKPSERVEAAARAGLPPTANIYGRPRQ